MSCAEPARRILCTGIIVLDEVFRVAEFPEPDGKVQATGFFVVNGGCAANAAVAIARLGGHVALAGPMGGPAGEDANGDRVLAAFAREHIDCSFCQRIAGLSTALSAIFMNARGDRTIVTYRDERIATAAPADPDAAVAAADAVLADNRYPQFVQPICEAARRRKIPVVLDGDRPTTEDDPLFRIASHVIFSSECLRATTGIADLAGGSRVSRAGPMLFSPSATGRRHCLSRRRQDPPAAGVRDRGGRYAWRRRRFSWRLCAGDCRRPQRGRGHALRRGGGRHQMYPARGPDRLADPGRSRDLYKGAAAARG